MNALEGSLPSRSFWRRLLLGLALLACATAALLGWRREAAARHLLRTQEQEMLRLREEAGSLQRKLQQLQVRQDELDRYRKQAEEVPRLRGHYQEWQRLKQEHAALKAELERFRAGQIAPPTQGAAVSPGSRGSWIGISLAQDPSGTGVSVLSLAPGGPAANAGVQAGDLILAADGRPISSFQQVKEIIRAKPSGDRVLLDLVRQGVRTLISVPTSPMPTFD